MNQPLPGFFFILTATASFACSCLSPPPVMTRAETSFAVFVDRAVSETAHDDERVYIFEALEVFKGGLPGTVIVTTNRYGSACGSSFSLEKKYLVFCYGTSPENLTTGLCAGNREASSKIGSDEVAQLRAAPKPIGEPTAPHTGDKTLRPVSTK